MTNWIMTRCVDYNDLLQRLIQHKQHELHPGNLGLQVVNGLHRSFGSNAFTAQSPGPAAGQKTTVLQLPCCCLHKIKNQLTQSLQLPHSTLDMPLLLSQKWLEVFNLKQMVRTIFLDISLAFDKVWNPVVFTKLSAYSLYHKRPSLLDF